MNHVKIWWSDSRGKVIVTLIVLWIAALIHSFQLVFVLFPIAAVSSVLLFDLVISRLKSGAWIATLSSVVTGLLIGLIFDPTAPMTLLILTCFIAVLSKQFLRFRPHQHIFNPATFGLVSTSILFNLSTAWWGVAWGVIPLIIIVVGMMLALPRIRRLWIPVIFLSVYFLFNGITGSWIGAVRLTLDGTLFLFAWIMLTEPITTVSTGIWEYIMPVVVAGLVIGETVLRIFITDPILLALLTANALGFLFIRYPRLRRS